VYIAPVDTIRRTKRPASRRPTPDLPFAKSVGYQVRATHRLLQRYLGLKIGPYDVTQGMWYFLRALWNKDGLTQRELSDLVGTMEPTTLSAILILEKKRLVRRIRSKTDGRKIHIYLTAKGHALREELLPLAKSVVKSATQSLSNADIARLLVVLAEIQSNLSAAIEHLERDAGLTVNGRLGERAPPKGERPK